MRERPLEPEAALRTAMVDMRQRRPDGILRAAVYRVAEPVPVYFLSMLDALARRWGFSAHQSRDRTYIDAKVFWIFNER